jgi:enoyl-CoA hydratase/carnithine racemase
MTRDLIAVDRAGPIATVVLNRPEKLNALTKSMWQNAWRRRSTRCPPTTRSVA